MSSGEGRIDTEAVADALRAKGAEECPACGDVDTATALSPTLIPIPGVTPIGSDDPNPPEGIQAVAVTCTNCGLVRLHDLLELLATDPAG